MPLVEGDGSRWVRASELERCGQARDAGVDPDEIRALGAPDDQLTIAEAARRMTEATVDILLCCKDPGLQIEAFEALVRLQEEDDAADRASRDSVARIHALRERFFLKPPPQPPLEALASPGHLALAEEISRRVHGSA